MRLNNSINYIRDIGIDQVEGNYQQKLSRSLNLICFYGFLWGLIQCFTYLPFDIISGLSHLAWGIVILICLGFRKALGFHAARNIIFFSIIAFGSYAAARLGNEIIAHLPVVTVYIAVFIFYDIKKEWFKVTLFFLYSATLILIVDSNMFKVIEIPEDVIPIIRAMTIVGTLIFVSIEIILLVKLSAINENTISKKLSVKNQELIELNKEKTVLLQEVHHRVKNNFQIISSLLKLQGKELNNPEVTLAFQQAINRINAVSQLHEQIYKSEFIADVNLKQYLERIAHTIIENNSDKRKIILNISEITLKLENNAILPLALIFNELLTNSLKHAFHDKSTGTISIQLTQTNDDRFGFVYEDDGKWRTPASEKTFGLELIETLAGQLDGVCNREINENGTKYTFCLSLKS